MRNTLSLVASPGTSIRWKVGDRVMVVLFENGPHVPVPYRVIYVDQQRISLEAVA